MEEILRDQYHAYVTVITAFREQVAHLLRIDVIQQIVEDHEARSLPLRVAKFLGDALVIPYVFPQTFQLSRGDGSSLAIAPDSAACKMALGAQGVEVLQETDAKGRLARPAGNAREWRLKFQIVGHAGGRCSLLLASRRSKRRGYVRPTFIPEREGRPKK